jgi:hypothetical protein
VRNDNRAPEGRRRRAVRAAVGVVVLALVIGAAGATMPGAPAVAAPGTPGVPGDPVVLFEEDFEQGTGITELEAYVSLSGATYTADPFWLNATACNGFILSQLDTFPGGTFCNGRPTEFADVRRKAAALGLLTSPQTATTNRAVSSNTSLNGPNNARQLASSMLSLPTDGRFITFSVDAAATSCGAANNPLLRLYLTTAAGVEIPVSGAAINPCTSSGTTTTSVEGMTVWYGRFVSDAPILHTGETLGITMRNQRGSGVGNDGAFDNIRVLDVTPQLDKSFEPVSTTTGAPSTLTLTVTNTSELAEKEGWGFTDALPSGLLVHSPANIGGTCDATVSAAAGASDIVVSDGRLAAGEGSCTITVDVTSNTIGTYENCAENIVDHIGVALPACASVSLLAPVGLSVTKTPAPEVITGPGQEIVYSFVVTNISDARIDDVEVTDIQHAPAGALTSGPTCPQPALDPLESMTCTATYLATDADVEHGRIDDTASASGMTEDGREVISNEADATVLVEPVLTWSLAKNVSLGGVLLGDGDTVAPGDVLTYEIVITSGATVDLDGVTISDDLSAVLDDAAFVSGSAQASIDGGAAVAVSDPIGDALIIGPFSLPVGAVATVTYQVTVDDDAWSRELTNTVTGTAGTPEDPIAPEPCGDACTTTQVTPAIVQVLKVGEDANGTVVPMDGSAWAVYDAVDATVAMIDPLPAAEDDGQDVTGLFRGTTLPTGTYWLEETAALPGFELLAERVEFSIAADGTVALTAGASSNVSLVDLDGVATIRVEDVPTLDLPEAGGPGGAPFLTVGTTLLALGAFAAVHLFVRRRPAVTPVAADTPRP